MTIPINSFLKYIFISLFAGLAVVLTGCPSTQSTTQPKRYDKKEALVYDDHIYEDSIRTVQLYQVGVEESYPVIYMGSTAPLVLEFDELIPEDEFESNFFVDIVHCDEYWRPTNVLPLEFYEGFTQDRIDLYERSAFTKTNYIHYGYSFPQENEYFKISGNYLLIVYRNSNKKDLVLSRRFVVADRIVSITPKYLLDDRIERIRMSEFSFDLSVPTSLGIMNPANDLTIMVMQNFRWDNAWYLGNPRVSRDNTYEYYLDLANIFRSGNEYRRLDIRSTRLYSESMQDVEETEQEYQIYLFRDEPRDFNIFLSNRRDRNGSYKPWVNEWPNADVNADYVNTHFTLKTDRPVANGKVYVYGRFSDWQLWEENRLDYNEEVKQYEGDVLLKQGLYDYGYAVKRPDDPIPDESTFEGKHIETENFYTIVVYYQGPTDRAPRIIGYQPINYYE